MHTPGTAWHIFVGGKGISAGRKGTNFGAAAYVTMHIVKGQLLLMAFVRYGGKEQIGGNCVPDACLAYTRIRSSVMVRNTDDDILLLTR